MYSEIKKKNLCTIASCAIETADSIDSVLHQLTGGVIQSTEVSGAVVLKADYDKNQLKGAAADPPELWPDFNKVVISLDDPVATVLALKGGGPVVIEDAKVDARTKKWLVRYYKCESILSVPIAIPDEKTFGCVVAVQKGCTRKFSSADIQKVELLAKIAGQAIKRLRASD